MMCGVHGDDSMWCTYDIQRYRIDSDTSTQLRPERIRCYNGKGKEKLRQSIHNCAQNESAVTTVASYYTAKTFSTTLRPQKGGIDETKLTLK